MNLSSTTGGLMSIVRDPIFRIDRVGLVLEQHIHEDSDPAFIDLDLVGKNIGEYEFFRDMRDEIVSALDSSSPCTSYFSWAYGGQLKHYEVLIEPQSSTEAIVLIREITRKKQRDNELLEYADLIQSIYEGTSEWTGHDYLDNLSIQLAKSLKSDCTAIFVLDGRNNELQTISIWEEGSVTKNLRGPVAGSPFSSIHSEGLLEIRSGFKDLYPDFFLLSSIEISSFVGVPMYYKNSNTPIGMMATMYREPIQSVRQIDKILKIFSSRAATELERMENLRQLENSEKKFKALYNNTPALFNSVDRNGLIIEVGDYFLEKTGYLREEVIGQHAFKFVTDASKQYAMTKVFPGFLKTGYCKDIPLQFVTKENQILDILFSATAVRNSEGQLEKIVTNLNDVTELKRIENDLKRREAQVVEAANRYQSLFDNSPVGIIIHTDGIIKHVNSETLKLLKAKSIESLVGKKALGFVHPDSVPAAEKRIKKIFRSGEAHRNEQKFICLDGSTMEAEAMGTLIDYDGKPSIQIAFYDISERKRAEEKIIERDKKLERLNEHLGKQNNQLEEFAHIASHNLRAPVTNMMSLIKIKENDPSPENTTFVWDSIKKTTLNLNETLVELNDVVKTSWELDKNKRELRFEDVLDKILESIGNEIKVANAMIDVDFEALSSIYYPKVYLESILQNLITNALKYSAPDRRPQIEIKSWKEGGKAFLSVKDNGVGVDLEKYGSKLFGLRKTFHDNADARGVGLFITKAQIESMGGEITVESEVGHGSIFTVNFGEL